MARAIAALALCALTVAPAWAQFKDLRALSEVDKRGLMAALLADPQMPMSEDPSCKADLSRPGAVSVSQALSEALARAAAEKPPRTVVLDCFKRPGYPLEAGQEYCRLAFVPARKPRDGGFGLLFLMDWQHKSVVSGSAECY
jgi:hypothetical protein